MHYCIAATTTRTYMVTEFITRWSEGPGYLLRNESLLESQISVIELHYVEIICIVQNVCRFVADTS